MDAPLSSLLSEAAQLGLPLSQLLPAAQIPWTLPDGARSLLLLASSGETFFKRFQACPPLSGPDPLDTYTERLLGDLFARLLGSDALALYFPWRPPFLPFRALLEAAQWGQVSPFGIVVHPEHGPWFALRVAVALPYGAGPVVPRAAPCLDCAAPCAAACPPGAARVSLGLDLSSCGEARRRGPCLDRCAAREACPVGTSWRYSREAITSHHLAASAFF